MALFWMAMASQPIFWDDDFSTDERDKCAVKSALIRFLVYGPFATFRCNGCRQRWRHLITDYSEAAASAMRGLRLWHIAPEPRAISSPAIMMMPGVAHIAARLLRHIAASIPSAFLFDAGAKQPGSAACKCAAMIEDFRPLFCR